MPKSKKSIDDRLLAAQVAIDNMLTDEEIKSYLARYGYTTERMNEGKRLYDTAQQLQQRQKAEYGDQFAATSALSDAWEKANVEGVGLNNLDISNFINNER